MFNILHQSPLSKNLQRLFLLRSIAIVVQCILFAFVYSVIELDVPWAEMTIIVIILILLNFFTWVRLHHTFPVSNLEFFAQLLMVDVTFENLEK